jgi:hypothetical protein
MHDRLLQLGARGPALIVSVAVACSLGALLPPPGFVAFTVGLVVVSLVLGSRRLEPVTLRLWYRVRPLDECEQVLLAPVITRLCQVGIGPPVVNLLMAARGAQEPRPIGRRTVRVSTGMIDQLATGRLSAEDAGAAMAYAIGVRDAGHRSFQMVYEFWMLPWQIIQTVTGGVRRMFTKLPLVGLAWRLRGLLGAAALAQCAQQGQWGIGLLAFVIVASTYVTPWCRAQWDQRLQRSASQFVVDLGLDQARLQTLRHEPGATAVCARSRRISGAQQVAPNPTRLVVSGHRSIGQSPRDGESEPAFCRHARVHADGQAPSRR